jgi:hypothetical protein
MTTSVPPSSPSAGSNGQAEPPPRLSEPTPRPYTAAREERLREARRMIWRDSGEPAVEVHDLWDCLKHGTRGGLRTSSSIYLLMDGYYITRRPLHQVPEL